MVPDIAAQDPYISERVNRERLLAEKSCQSGRLRHKVINHSLMVRLSPSCIGQCRR